ncbi:MAG TPA: hypothetical protein VGF16_10510 [Bryobacteraceae bacterium]
MTKRIAAIGLALTLACAIGSSQEAAPAPPKALIFFSLNVEADHVLFATSALEFFAKQADRHNFRTEATSN